MKKWKRELQGLVAELVGDGEFSIGTTAKDHIKVWMRGPAGTATVVVGSHMKDRHGMRNAKAEIRRHASQIGCEVRV